MRVLILGRTEVLYEVATRLVEDGRHTVAAIITAAARPEYGRDEEDFLALGERCGAPVLVCRHLGDEALRLIRDSRADVGVSINWVSIIDDDVISLLPRCILNGHFGDLPRYRGNAVPNWAMLLGEDEIRFTLHEMEPGELDSGDIWSQRRLALAPETTIADILEFARRSFPEMVLETLESLESGARRPLRQADRGMTPFRCYPRLPRDGRIDWSRSAVEIDRLVRSLARPYSGAYTFYRHDGRLEKLYVWSSRVVARTTVDVAVPGHVIRNDPDSGESWIHTGGGVLALREVSHGSDGEPFAPGGRWRSVRKRLGMDLEEEVLRLVRRFEDR